MRNVYLAARTDETGEDILAVFERRDDAWACVNYDFNEAKKNFEDLIAHGWEGSFEVEDHHVLRVKDPDTEYGGYVIDYGVYEYELHSKWEEP